MSMKTAIHEAGHARVEAREGGGLAAGAGRDHPPRLLAADTESGEATKGFPGSMEDGNRAGRTSCAPLLRPPAERGQEHGAGGDSTLGRDEDHGTQDRVGISAVRDRCAAGHGGGAREAGRAAEFWEG